MAPQNADIDHDRRTVLVQGVSFEMDDRQFEEAFSEIGPIRKCFLVRHRGQQRHKARKHLLQRTQRAALHWLGTEV